METKQYTLIIECPNKGTQTFLNTVHDIEAPDKTKIRVLDENGEEIHESIGYKYKG